MHQQHSTERRCTGKKKKEKRKVTSAAEQGHATAISFSAPDTPGTFTKISVLGKALSNENNAPLEN